MRSRTFAFDDHQFVLTRGVFDPVRHLSGLAFAEQLQDVLAAQASGARTALDLGTGCGVLAATMARLGLQVVATDINESAVICATQNCQELDVDVRHGDMFDPVEGDTFDLVVVNPPYERGEPTWRKSRAYTSPDFLETFGAQVHQFAETVVVGFPIDELAELDATGLDLTLWRTIPTTGRDLGLFVSRA